MRHLFRSLTIARRLSLLTILFGLGLAALGGIALDSQWTAMRAQKIAELRVLDQVVISALNRERAQATAAHESEDAFKTRALALVAAIRYESDGFFTVVDPDGVVLAHPDARLIGKNFRNAPDSNGFRFLADVIPRALRDGTAEVAFSYPRPGGTESLPKIAVYTVYTPLGWLIQTAAWLDTIQAVFWSSARLMIAIAGGVLLVVIGLAVLVGQSIVRPLGGIQLAMGRVADGQDVALPEVELGGEIGAMARAVLVFRDAGAAKTRLEEAAAETQRRAAAERERQAAADAAAQQQQQAVVQHLADGLSHLADGDLTFRLNQVFAAEYETLRADYNRAMGQMQATVETIVSNVGRLRSGGGEITAAADELSRRTEQQAASLEETAAALDQITTTVRKTADGARQAREVVSAAQINAQKSEQVVQDAVNAMTAIEGSAQQISQIIGVIDEIAFQTNLLALNAGVEAARAGDAGRGFAVVASEVRSLAQRSAEAAKEIKDLISKSSQQVGRGVELVGATGKSLALIVTQVGQINGVVGEIAASAQEQATALGEVNTAINQMDQVTQQNAAMVEESTAASHSLAQDTEELAHLTEGFQVGAAARPVAGSVRQPRALAKAAARPVRALKVVDQGRGGAARKPLPQTREDDWQEF
jgi:methyl-accepting chemotaxis protein